MKYPYFDLGGRPFTNDDLVTLQTELTAAIQAQFLGKGPFILSGCVVSGTGPAYNITAGIVCLDGQLLRFAGAGAITLPAQLQAGAPILSDPRLYQTGGTKDCMREVPAVLVASDPAYTGGEFLPLHAWGGLRWNDVVRASVQSLGDVKMSANVTLTDFDNGIGKPGTAVWGWGLCDGVNGRADLRGRFVVGLDPTRADYDTIGDTGGEEKHTLTIPEMPNHNHSSEQVARYQDIKALPNTGGDNAVRDRGGLSLSSAGGDQPHENRPPFYTLAILQWVGYQ